MLALLVLIGLSNAVIRISDDESYQITPFGYWLSDCHHSVPSGAEIINFDDHFTVNGEKVPRCRVPHNSTYIKQRIASKLGLSNDNVAESGNGWQAYTKQDAGKQVTSFNGTWTVPPLPVHKSILEVLYTFTALQNIDWVPPERNPNEPFDIIQPVLQYGDQSGQGGTYFIVYINLLFVRILM